MFHHVHGLDRLPTHGVRLTSPPHSAVREHSESCGAAVDIDSFRVLSTSSYELDLRILESLFIFFLN